MPILHLSVSRELMTAIRQAAGDTRVDDWVRLALTAQLSRAIGGRLGGLARAAALTPEQRSDRARHAATVRQERIRQAAAGRGEES